MSQFNKWDNNLGHGSSSSFSQKYYNYFDNQSYYKKENFKTKTIGEYSAIIENNGSKNFNSNPNNHYKYENKAVNSSHEVSDQVYRSKDKRFVKEDMPSYNEEKKFSKPKNNEYYGKFSNKNEETIIYYSNRGNNFNSYNYDNQEVTKNNERKYDRSYQNRFKENFSTREDLYSYNSNNKNYSKKTNFQNGGRSNDSNFMMDSPVYYMMSNPYNFHNSSYKSRDNPYSSKKNFSNPNENYNFKSGRQNSYRDQTFYQESSSYRHTNQSNPNNYPVGMTRNNYKKSSSSSNNFIKNNNNNPNFCENKFMISVSIKLKEQEKKIYIKKGEDYFKKASDFCLKNNLKDDLIKPLYEKIIYASEFIENIMKKEITTFESKQLDLASEKFSHYESSREANINKLNFSTITQNEDSQVSDSETDYKINLTF